jgi:hypothetical protein
MSLALRRPAVPTEPGLVGTGMRHFLGLQDHAKTSVMATKQLRHLMTHRSPHHPGATGIPRFAK